MPSPADTTDNNASASDLELLASSVRDFCTRSLPRNRLRALAAAKQSCDREAWRDMLELGWGDIALPADADGLDFGAAGVTLTARELGRVLAREPFLESAVAATALLGAATNGAAALAQCRSGARVYTVPVRRHTLSGHGSIRLERRGADFLVHGTVRDIPLVDIADRVLVPVLADSELVVLDLDIGSANIALASHLLADGSFAGDLEISDLPYAGKDLLRFDGDGAPALKTAMTLHRIAGSAYLLGLSEALLDLTLEYVRTRSQFGRAIGSFQALQHRLVDAALQTRLAGAAVQDAVAAYTEHAPHAHATALRAQRRACETAMLISREAIQMHGAIGYTAECDVALFVWRGLVMTARFGDALAALKDEQAFMQAAVTHPDTERTGSGAADPVEPPAGDWNALSDERFRDTVRAWIAANYPEHLRHLPYQLRWSEIRDWHKRLVARGWAAPAWPREHGGMGLETGKLLIFIEELERHGVARAPDQGIVMLGPILFAHGTEEQRERFLAKALTGEQIWCQGYSEPNAGSDLASLATRAEADGDEFVINGQKTWTTHALDATHMYCLVRTDPDVKPQAGISFLLIDLDQPGVTRRPIPNLGGHVDFCEVFLDNVRAPRDNLVGELNRGWTIAKDLLGHERLFVGSPKLCQHALNQLRLLAEHRGLLDDPVFTEALVNATLDVSDLEAFYGEFAAIVRAGDTIGPDIALLKIWSTETYARLSELIFRYSGPGGARIGGATDAGVDAVGHYYNARPAPIYAGSNEIQRNIVARHVLNLPT